MSDVNKLDNKQCPFDLGQYQVNVKVNDVAPEGSFPWAMIKIYSGKVLRRSGWDNIDKYIFLSSDSTPTGNRHFIEGNNENAPPTYWQPTQEDMLACDWIDCMLSFDLTLGTSTFVSREGTPGQDWGYLDEGGWFGTKESTFGTLTGIHNKTVIENILMFYWGEENPTTAYNGLYLRISSGKNNYQKMLNLVKKTLSVTVNGITYNLGAPTPPNSSENSEEYRCTSQYQSADAKKLGILLQNNVNQTFHFCFNWL